MVDTEIALHQKQNSSRIHHPPEAYPDLVPLNTEDARTGDPRKLVQDLNDALNVRQPPSAEVLTVLLSRSVENYTLPRPTSKSVNEIHQLTSLALEGAAYLPPDQQLEVFQSALSLLEKVPHDGESEDQDFYIRTIMNTLRETGTASAAMGSILDYVYEHSNEYQYNIYPENKLSGTPINKLLNHIESLGAFRDEALLHIANLPEGQKRNKLLGMVLDTLTYPNLLNQLRELIETKGAANPELKGKLEAMGKMLLGLDGTDDSLTFFTKLKNLYTSIDFSQYKPNIEGLNKDLSIIEDLIGPPPSMSESGSGKSPGIILDLGCGTGRIANGLAARGYGDVVGIDRSLEHVKLAKKNDTTEKVTYMVGDMIAVPMPDDSVRKILLMGRTLPHAEDDYRLSLVADELERLLPVGGEVIFDMPNGRKGGYEDDRAEYMELLKKLEVPTEPTGEYDEFDNAPYALRGPTASNKYNRYVPDFNKLEGIFRVRGFRLEEVRRDPIAEGSPDENIVYKAVKIEQKDDMREFGRRRR